MGFDCNWFIAVFNTINDAEYLDNIDNHTFEFDKRDNRIWLYPFIVSIATHVVFPKRNNPGFDDL